MADPAHVATVLWSSADSALTLACIRTHGQREAAAVEYETERRHLEPSLSPYRTGGPRRCAEALLDLEHRAGLRPEVTQDAAGRVWLRYRTPHWSGHGTAGPPTTPAAYSAAIGEAHHRARHGTTAALIGGPTVTFVHTHDVTDGDACDAGYFETGPVRLAPDDRYRRQRGEPLPVFAAAAPLPSPEDHPRSPWVSAAAMRMIVIVERLGEVGGVAVVEHALRTAFTAVGGWLPGALSLAPVRTPLDAARLYAAVGATVGDEVVVADGRGEPGGHATAGCATDRLWDGHAHVPRSLRDTVVRAWSASLPHHGWGLRARPEEPDPPHGGTRVRFDRAGPGA